VLVVVQGIDSTDPAMRQNRADTPEERYRKMAKVASRFNIVQFGLTVFTATPGAAKPFEVRWD
jgi:hypothetical protein